MNEFRIKNIRDKIKALKERKIILEQKKYITNAEIKKLEENSIVKRYISLLNENASIDERLENINKVEYILKQESCLHDFVYLMEIQKNVPINSKFKCICCGKMISGYLDRTQECVNQGYLREDNNMLYGSEEEYDVLHEKYTELLDKKCNKIDIRISLQRELFKEYDSSTLVYRR